MALVNLKQTEFANTSFSVLLKAGETLEQVLVPEYWAHVAAALHLGDEVIVTADDYSWRATLVVTSVEKTSAKVAVYQFRDLAPGKLPFVDVGLGEADAEEGSASYLRRWNAKLQVHEIVRLSDNEIVASLKDKAEAEAKLAELSKSLV